MEEILMLLEEIRPNYDFRTSEDFTNGGLDSIDTVALVSEIEEKYGVSIDGLDILPENFKSLETIVELVKKSGGKIV